MIRIRDTRVNVSSMSIYLNLVSQLLKNNDTNYTQKSHLYQRDTSNVVQKLSFCLALSRPKKSPAVLKYYVG